MSFVPKDEAKRFDTDVIGFWSQLSQRDATSPFHMPHKLGGLGVGSTEQRLGAAPWRAWQTVLPTLMTASESSDADTFFASTLQLRAQLLQLQAALSRQKERSCLTPLSPLVLPSEPKPTQKRPVKSIQFHLHK